MRSDLVVLSIPDADGERFAIIRPDTLPLTALFRSPSEDWRDGLSAYLRSVPVLKEEELRARLAEIGYSSEAADAQIQRARNLQALNAQTIWERTTRIGYRNEHQQEVIRKTRLAGSLPDQRIFVLRCGDCGHEYDVNGCEIHARTCPQCHGGMRRS